MSLILFDFEGKDVRVVGTPESPEWVAQDVFEAMGLKWQPNLIAEYDETEADLTLITVRSETGVIQEREVWALKEPGLYTAMLRARNAMKPGTRPYRFRKWVTTDLLPKLRADGGYIMPTATNEQIKGLERQLNNMQKKLDFFGHSRKSPEQMFWLLHKYNPGISVLTILMDGIKVFPNKKRLTLDEYESILPPSVKLPWRD